MTTGRRNIRKIPDIDRGAAITAEYLNRVGTAVNENTRFLSGPRQQQALDESEGGNATNLNLDFTETLRTETEVAITDSNGDTFTVSQIDYVEFTNSAGDTLTLTFNNP